MGMVSLLLISGEWPDHRLNLPRKAQTTRVRKAWMTLASILSLLILQIRIILIVPSVQFIDQTWVLLEFPSLRLLLVSCTTAFVQPEVLLPTSIVLAFFC